LLFTYAQLLFSHYFQLTTSTFTLVVNANNNTCLLALIGFDIKLGKYFHKFMLPQSCVLARHHIHNLGGTMVGRTKEEEGATVMNTTITVEDAAIGMAPTKEAEASMSIVVGPKMETT
jgi:hypothetical protein